MKKLYMVIILVLFFLVSIVGYGLPAQEMKNYAVLCDTFESLIIDNPKTHLKMDEFGLNAIAGILISFPLKEYCEWGGDIDPKFIKARYNSDEFEEELTKLRNEVYNAKYASADDKERMLQKVAEFYRKHTVGKKPSEGGVVINHDNIEKLNSVYSIRRDFDYADDLDLGWNVEWGDKNDVVLHYEKYEIVIPFELGEEKEKLKIDPTQIKFYVHEENKPRRFVLGFEELKVAEYISYITGKCLELEMFISQINTHK